MHYRILLLGLSFCLFLLHCNKDDSDPIVEEPLGTERFNSLVFPNFTKDADVVYGSNTTLSGATQDLDMNIFQPVGDSLRQRPLVIMAHGGGFVAGNKSELEALGSYFSRSGYVFASIGYRLVDIEQSSENILKGVADALADMKAAVRFFRKEASTYGIDTTNIFIGGYSAGAITALHYAYLDELTEVSTMGGATLVNHLNANGGFEGNSGNAGYSSQVKGVINIAGALGKADFLSIGDPILFSIHGTSDDIVPYLEGESNGTGIVTQGSGLIHPIADALGIENELKAIENGGHGAFVLGCDDCDASIRHFISEHLD